MIHAQNFHPFIYSIHDRVRVLRRAQSGIVTEQRRGPFGYRYYVVELKTATGTEEELIEEKDLDWDNHIDKLLRPLVSGDYVFLNQSGLLTAKAQRCIHSFEERPMKIQRLVSKNNFLDHYSIESPFGFTVVDEESNEEVEYVFLSEEIDVNRTNILLTKDNPLLIQHPDLPII